MQNRYTGDLGDFGKYGLLKTLCTPRSEFERKLRLGVVWYLVPNESGSDDGKHINYLHKSHRNDRLFRRCAPELYDSLAGIIESGKRSVESIRLHSVLPDDTIFFEDPLTFEGMKSIGQPAIDARRRHRTNWLQRGMEMTSDCDLIFVDPDNGLEVKVKRHTKKGPKYAYYNELMPFLKRGQTMVIYQHMCRTGKAKEQIEKRLCQLDERFGYPSVKFALLYHRGTLRTFFIIPSEDHADLLCERIERFISGPWSQHFTMYE